VRFATLEHLLAARCFQTMCGDSSPLPRECVQSGWRLSGGLHFDSGSAPPVKETDGSQTFMHTPHPFLGRESSTVVISEYGSAGCGVSFRCKS
jgi:hypothetical protein